jgi:PKD repeat protein
MKSKIISVVLCLGVVLALTLVPGVPPVNMALAQPSHIGVNVTPQQTTVGFNGNFNVVVWINDSLGENYDGVGIRLVYNTSYVTATGVTDAGTFDWVLNAGTFNNTWNATHGLVKYDAANMGGAINASNPVCTISFTSNSSNTGISGLDFIYIGADAATSVTSGGADILNWTMVVNGTVKVGTPQLTVNVTPVGTGTVKANGVTLTGYPNTTNRSWDANVTLLAVNSTQGYGFVNWTGDVANPNAISTTVTMDDFTKNVTANFAVAAMPGCNNGSVNVAFVPDPDGPGGGELPTGNSAFSDFSFTNVPYASVNATTLANYDTVVLIMCDPMNDTTPSQQTDIVDWVSNGGKLIIYDSECFENGTINNSWLPYPYTTYCPGGWGASKDSSTPWVDLWILENNTLSSSDPISPYYINTTMIAEDTDAAGDQNVFITKSAGWCGDMMGTNALNTTYSTPPGTTGYSHAYAHYNKGLFIYNGLDIDYLGSESDPTANTGEGYLAKIWLLELGQTWDNVTGTTVCGLPCEAPIPPPTPVCVAPTAEFSATPITGLAPLRVQFTDMSTGTVTSWLWDFGDGKTSTAQNPTNTYMKEGKYTVSLTVSGSCGEDTETKVNYIIVLSERVEPASLSCSGLYISPQQVKPGDEVTISINVANSGGETGSYNAVLYINGAVETSQSVSVAGGTSKNVIFKVTKSDAGVYDVSICGQSGQFTVVHTGWFGGGLGTGGIVAIVVIVIVLIMALFFVLRGTRRAV